MFGNMRRKDRELSTEEAQSILERNRYGVLSVICENGYPYGIPIHYVMLDDKIYFHSTSDGGMKADAMEKCPKVCFTVIEPLEGVRCQSAIAFGVVRAASELRAAVLEKIVEKFVPEIAWKQAKEGIPYAVNRMQAYEITVQHLTAKVVDKPEGR